jgi:hypothetical protein
VAWQFPKHLRSLRSQDDVERHLWLDDSQNSYSKAILLLPWRSNVRGLLGRDCAHRIRVGTMKRCLPRATGLAPKA